jgi:hypothetical protein
MSMAAIIVDVFLVIFDSNKAGFFSSGADGSNVPTPNCAK